MSPVGTPTILIDRSTRAPGAARSSSRFHRISLRPRYLSFFLLSLHPFYFSPGSFKSDAPWHLRFCTRIERDHPRTMETRAANIRRIITRYFIFVRNVERVETG